MYWCIDEARKKLRPPVKKRWRVRDFLKSAISTCFGNNQSFWRVAYSHGQRKRLYMYGNCLFKHVSKIKQCLKDLIQYSTSLNSIKFDRVVLLTTSLKHKIYVEGTLSFPFLSFNITLRLRTIAYFVIRIQATLNSGCSCFDKGCPTKMQIKSVCDKADWYYE